MPYISSLKINRFRNLTAVDLSKLGQFNFFWGKNGAGKTSLLEAIYYLGLGRSFRTHLTNRLIQNSSNYFSIFTRIDNTQESIPLGIERYLDGKRLLKADGESISNWAPLAQQLPLCLLSPMNTRFLIDGPRIRRQFIDWILFHVEPSFFPTWQDNQRCLKQRNAALRSQRPLNEITYWDEIFIKTANLVHELREKIILEFSPLFTHILEGFLPEYSLKPYYFSGWEKGKSLDKLLARSINYDRQSGHTHIGPHRADFSFLIQGLPARDILSQGQQKLLTYALYITQGLLFKKKTSETSVYLIDDLSAELDVEKREKIINLLVSLESQIFITGINPQDLKIPQNSLMFHVEHGEIKTI